MSKQEHCEGCRNDFYNGHNELGVKQCWSLESAKVVTRWKIPWWQSPPTGEKVETLDCWYAPGKYAMYRDNPQGASDAR